ELANRVQAMTMIALYLLLWIGYMFYAVTLSAPIVYFGRKRVLWNTLDLLALVLPFGVWVALMVSGEVGKSLANFGDYSLIAGSVAVAACIRVLVGKRFPAEPCSIVMLVMLCVVAACVYWWSPPLPE